jgi:ppGpp synthetase/RelA/SpoT-type nucleotidyltranferase
MRAMPAKEDFIHLYAHRARTTANQAQVLIDPLIDRQRSEISSIIHASKSRIKSFERIVEKTKGQRHTQSASNVDEIDPLTDIFGARIVTLFQNDISRAVEFIINMVKHNLKTPSPIVKDRVIGVLIITSRPEGDPLSLVEPVTAIIDGAGIEISPRVERRRSGYSSVHIICEFKSNGENDALSSIPIEFQIRSAFEEVWGEIDHKLRYGAYRGAVDATAWDRHLNALKSIVDGCIQYADVIKHQADATKQRPLTTEEEKKTVRPAFAVLKQFADLPKNLYSLLEEAYSVLSKAEKPDDPDNQVSSFLEAAALFDKINADVSSREQLTKSLKKKLEHQLSMEFAYCLINTNLPEDCARAIEIYDNIEQHDPHDSVARYRHGQAFRKSGRFHEAIQKMKEAYDILNKGGDPNIEEGHWIHIAVRNQIAYTHWQISDALPEGPARRKERLKELKNAIVFSQEALELARDKRDKIRAINSLVYYLWEERQVKSRDVEPSVLDNDFLILVKSLESAIDVQNETNVDQLDTLARGLEYFGYGDKSVVVAQRIIKLLAERIRKMINRAGEEESGVENDKVLLVAAQWLDRNDLDTLNHAYQIIYAAKGQG